MENPWNKGYNPFTGKYKAYMDSGKVNNLKNLGPGIAHTSDAG
jgi:hypothetical protein